MLLSWGVSWQVIKKYMTYLSVIIKKGPFWNDNAYSFFIQCYLPTVVNKLPDDMELKTFFKTKEYSLIPKLYQIFHLSMSIAFGVQFYFCIEKFISPHTVRIVTREVRESLELPGISICRYGLRNVSKENSSSALNDISERCQGPSEKEFWACYLEHFYQLDDVFIEAYISKLTSPHVVEKWSKVKAMFHFMPLVHSIGCWTLETGFQAIPGRNYVKNGI